VNQREQPTESVNEDAIELTFVDERFIAVIKLY